MSSAWNIALVLGLLGGLLGAMAGLKQIAKTQDWHPELQRKIIHVSAGGLACGLPWILPQAWQVWLLLGLTALAMMVLRTGALGGIGSALHGVERKSWGDFLLVLSVALVFLLYGGEPVFYVLPLAILTLADAAAALAGVRYGRTFFVTEDGRKSVEGSAMFLMVALILSMICLLLLTDIPRANVIVLAAAVAIFATALEADSWDGFDNLFLPMGVFILLSTLTGETPQALLLQVGLALIAAVALYMLRRRMGSGVQVARVHGIAMFLLLCAIYPINALLPAMAMVLPAWLYPPLRKGRLALEWVGALALLSFLYFAYEPLTGLSAINFYGLAVAGMIAAWVGFTTQGDTRRIVRFALVAAVGLAALWFVVMELTHASAHWHGNLLGPAAAALWLTAIVAGVYRAKLAARPVLWLSLLGSAQANGVLIYVFFAGLL